MTPAVWYSAVGCLAVLSPAVRPRQKVPHAFSCCLGPAPRSSFPRDLGRLPAPAHISPAAAHQASLLDRPVFSGLRSQLIA